METAICPSAIHHLYAVGGHWGALGENSSSQQLLSCLMSTTLLCCLISRLLCCLMSSWLLCSQLLLERIADLTLHLGYPVHPPDSLAKSFVLPIMSSLCSPPESLAS